MQIWRSCLRQFPLRSAILLSLALLFSCSQVLLPVLLVGPVWQLLLAWLALHFCGRVQTVLLLPIWHHIKSEMVGIVDQKDDAVLLSEGQRRHCAAKMLWHIDATVRSVEIMMMQIFPQAFGLVLRTVVLWHFFPKHHLWVVIGGIGSLLCIGVGVYCTDKRRGGWQQDAHSYDLYHKDILSQRLFLTPRTLRKNPYASLCFKNAIQKECIKSGMGGWIVTLGLLWWIHPMEGSFQGLLLWLGLGDQIWGAWGGAAEYLALPKVSSIAQEKMTIEAISAIRCETLSMFANSSPITLLLQPGDTLQLIGANGSGKTSFLRMLLGAVPYKGGKLTLNHLEAAQVSVKHRVVLGSSLLLVSGVLADYVKPSDLELFGLQAAVDALPAQIKTSMAHIQGAWSQGMLQKINLLYALATESPLYLLDEACNHLSIKDEVLFYNRLREHKPNAIIIYVSHQMVASKHCVCGQKEVIFG
ncbi:ABC transporter ATP-binding protein [Candidatus Synchoanobacter obligatus]|uniref:ABC transporter ATP-binding protein n=1 Tax=Candidatus Synchoanobacter obligatus TaxID=2919597 RepID=A0ABT1L654_9GAMM|nr:ABC transporter ATP-binding protein [Candidatus Synchoanobacter obligatus]MCP8352215.1 ABC transporter ATP-binding protein [Candidatus Synchoanobacter obligatus]